MAHLHRFFATPEDNDPSAAILRDEEAHHAIHVVRLRVGDCVEVMNGRGHSWTGTIASVSRRDVTLHLSGEKHVTRPAADVTLALGWLHRDKSVEEVIRRCTEAGVNRFLFFRADRSERGPQRSHKWERLVIESCKQCGRLWLPEFDVAESLDDALRLTNGTLLVATKNLTPQPLGASLHGSDCATFFVGPEGDFSEDELSRIVHAGGRAISLGEQTLRSEVAALVGSALILYELGQLGPRSA